MPDEPEALHSLHILAGHRRISVERVRIILLVKQCWIGIPFSVCYWDEGGQSRSVRRRRSIQLTGTDDMQNSSLAHST